MNVKRERSTTGQVYLSLETANGEFVLTEAEAHRLRDQLVDALGLPDRYAAFEDLLAACLRLVDQATVGDNEPGYVCWICGEPGELPDLICHEPGCAVGMAMAAVAKAKGEGE